ncbi:MAG: T9SS type A sorting domain-containing protein [Flavobacteriaceae bacterium]
MIHKICYNLFFIASISFSQNYTEYATGSTTDITTNHSFGICMMGGSSENDNAMRWFLNKTDGGDIVVLRASGSDGYNDYMYSKLGVAINSVTTFVIHNKDGAIDPYVLNKVTNAEGIWFAGGDQFNYVNYFKDNAMEDALNAFINTKKGVIGGTSAGMAILGNYYFDAANGSVTSEQALENPYTARISLGYNDFLDIPFLESIVTDTHYDARGRRGRHSVFLARFATDNSMRSFGIACNERTAVCIDNNGKASVFGSYPNHDSYAYFLQANCTENFDPETCVASTPLTWDRNDEAIKVYKVSGNNTGENYFDLSDWNTGSGGIWENWYVENGNFFNEGATNPNCILSIEESQLNNVSIYPNPFADVVNIETNSKNVKLQLFDINGKELEAKFNKSNQLNTKNLASGVYFLKLKLENGEQTFKLIKE